MTETADRLPIDTVLAPIRDTLARANRLVLGAPPGAGKTTRLPLDLLEAAQLAPGRLILLEPRRIAARAAAERMAAVLGERVGQTVGLATRLDRKVSSQTRIEVVTDGLFIRRILADPELTGISAVLFDEFHERGLNGDLGLALTCEVQDALREDLRLIVMSATLETEAIAAALGAERIECAGRQFDVETRYLGRDREARLEDQVARAVHRGLAEETGSVLVFLPGAGEIRRTAERLADTLPAATDLAPLFGALSPHDQDRAIRPPAPGRRKVVLATDIAESALTIEGVRVVIDAGLARLPEHDGAGGRVRLVTRRCSRASADQRRGRAGRTAPGVCYRLWDEAETRGLPARIEPEILRGDLSGLVLALADWGTGEPASLAWLDPPPSGRLAAGRERLLGLGALDDHGHVTPRGRAMAALPLSPGAAALVCAADTPGTRAMAARIAAVLSERGVGGDTNNLAQRLAAFERDTSPRAKALRRQATRWGGDARPSGDPARIVARAWPEAIARARRSGSGDYLLASGQAARIDPADPLARSDWLAVADAVGAAQGARITLAAALETDDAMALGSVETRVTGQFDRARQRVQARHVTRLGAITLSQQPLPAPTGEVARTAIAEAIAQHGLDAIRAKETVTELIARVGLLHRTCGPPWPDWTLDALMAEADSWLLPLIDETGHPPGAAIVRDGLVARLDWPLPRALDRLAPVRLDLPSGRAARIDYLDEKAPLVAAQVQELFGLTEHPTIADGLPVTLTLLSPAQRPVAITRDLAGFWAVGYHDMAKDMRARYPKHDWPRDPASARPHTGRTRARLQGG